MSWLRLDDGFTKHPKFEGWPPAQRWAWLEVMEYCARYGTEGRIPTDLTLLPKAATQTLLERAERAGWCDRHEDGSLWIHDWEDYNPGRSEDLEEAVEAALRERPHATANEVVRIVGGNRKRVLALIRQFRSGTAPVPVPGSGAGSRTGYARAFPSRPVLGTDSSAGAGGTTPAPAPADDELELRKDDPVVRLLLQLRDRDGDTERILRAFAPTVPGGSFDYVRDELQRTGGGAGKAVRILQRIEAEGTLVTPADAAANGATLGPTEDPRRRRERFVRANGYRLPDDELEYQLREMGADPDEITGHLDTAYDLRAEGPR